MKVIYLIYYNFTGDFPADLRHEKRCEEDNCSSYSSSDSSDFSTDSQNDFDKIEIPCFTAPSEIEQLREFDQRINQNDLDILLGILRPNLLPTLTKSVKTFLRTIDAEYNIIEMEDANNKPGQFVYFGIKQGLEACINSDLHKNENIRLQMNVDGLPLSKSNNDHFWPILAKVICKLDVYEVFTVAIYFGPSKPKSTEEYLEEFIIEINELLKNGIIIHGVHLAVELMCFICDTPARAFIKNTLGHKGKESCERCEIVGTSLGHRTIFPSVNEIKRTDESFRT